MKLGVFIEKRHIPDNFDLTVIPLKHPETGAKIYLKSRWFSGFWYTEGPAQKNGQIFPCQYHIELTELEVHQSALRMKFS